MANHKSALKRIRSDKKKRLNNRYQRKTCSTFIKKLQNTTDSKSASKQLNTVTSMIDKLAKRRIIHKNKSANLKAKLTKHVNKLAS